MMRARREEEIPVLLKEYEDEKAKEAEFWEKEETERVRIHALLHYLGLGNAVLN
jgi:hypothetical protein